MVIVVTTKWNIMCESGRDDRGLICGAVEDSSSRDDLDALLPASSDCSKIKAAIEHYQAKIMRTKEAIKAEQTSRDENVNEYLKLAANADKVQTQRIKSMFEKKNQKSAHTIAQLQKKLDSYLKRIRDIENYGIQALHQHSRSKAMLSNVGHGLKGVGTNIKEGISGLSEGVIGSIKSFSSPNTHHSSGDNYNSKPKDCFKNKIGSVDNLNSVDNSINESSIVNESDGNEVKESKSSGVHNQGGSVFYTHSHTHSHSTKHTSDESSSITSGSDNIGAIPGLVTSGGSSASPAKQLYQTFDSQLVSQSGSSHNINDLEAILSQLREREGDCQRIAEEIEAVKTSFQAEYSLINQSLQEERYKSERLEEQMNDLIELHQNEIENLKQNIGDMEEKVQYQSEERLRDIYEMLESCQTRISRMEHQQHQHLQQLVNLDSLENSNARALVLKLINVLLTVLQVILLLVATVANIVTPFLKTRIRFLTTIFILVIVMIFARQKAEFVLWFQTRIIKRFPIILKLLPEDVVIDG
ncbi:transmembrane and coiled-coil domains protein 1-like [Panonychus citri]|uniref:transmembrane and coiled-coil domains protein 1-like n=1 Tax=Panonychus citri TaxID=50023 RepID=UPI002307A91C|nr:transmembrane and coiled-coil domains protein 1-like [Panonychus citri]